jgi:hypothetical protein
MEDYGLLTGTELHRHDGTVVSPQIELEFYGYVPGAVE